MNTDTTTDTEPTVDELVVINKAMYDLYEEARAKVQAAFAMKVVASSVDREQFDTVSKFLFRSELRLIRRALPGVVVQTADGPLVLTCREGDNTFLVEDGGEAWMTWHDGPISEPLVRYERWSKRGRESHGFLDAKSRCIVQTG